MSFTESVKEHLAFLRLDYSGEKVCVLERIEPRRLRDSKGKCSYLSMPWDFYLIFTVLGVVLPWRGQHRLRKLLALPEVTSKERISLYISTIVFQWFAVGITVWRVHARGVSAKELALSEPTRLRVVLAAVAGGGILALLHWMNLRRMARVDPRRTSQLRAISERILPRQSRELIPYLGLAITAGLCEEYLYRGFAMAALFRAGLPTAVVVLLSSFLFGLAHLYQGRSGLLGTFLLGVMFAIARIAYDSLLPVAVWHSTVDVVAGLAGPRYLLRAARSAGNEVPNDV